MRKAVEKVATMGWDPPYTVRQVIPIAMDHCKNQCEDSTL